MSRYLGIDIGGTEIKYGIFNDIGDEFIGEKGSIKSVRDDLDKIIDILVGIIKNAKDIDGVGISIPGGVDSENGIIIEGGAIPVLAGVDLIGILKKKTGFNIAIENDANCVVLAEKWIGNGKDCSSFVCMTIGTGIKVFEMIENCDEVVIEVYRKWLRKLCIGINNIGFSIDPEKFLIGGGISGAPRLISDIKDELNKINPYTKSWKIETCKHFNSSGKIGAVYNYLVRNELI